MTPAEHARPIDKQEFEAECRAVRQRALARLGIKEAEDRARVQGTIAIPVKPGTFERKPTRVAKPHTVAGRSLTRKQWAAELGISYAAMNMRVRKHGSSLEAVVIRRLGGSANG